MYRPVLSLLVAFAGYSILNISQAGQKIGLGLVRTHRFRGSVIWAAATLGTSAAAFVNLYALSLGSVSLVGAMAGSGLASLALFSWLVMREPIGVRELAGIGTVFAAAALIGAFAADPAAAAPRLRSLYLLLAGCSAGYAVLWAAFRRRDRLAAPLIAGFSGALGGFVALFQKVSTTEHGRSRSLARGLEALPSQPGGVAETLSNPYALAWIVLSVLSMVVIQFAYRRGNAIRIIPAFSANYVVFPILGGMVVFGETLHPFQWVGVALIVAGVLVLTVRGREPARSSAPASTDNQGSRRRSDG
ncbi:MAG: DMT family transporter [Spirochaetales bacterium]|nr:DMT family transporter [Spirochaetales bacterium]